MSEDTLVGKQSYPYEYSDKELELKKVQCRLCLKFFSRVTNTHLWTQHATTMSDYQAKFLMVPVDRPGLANERVSHLRGKSYEDVYGFVKAEEMKDMRSEAATEQFRDPAQRVLRSEASTGREVSEETRSKISESRTTEWGTYRERALEYYGLECARCGHSSEVESDFVVHHKNMLNVPTELGDHSVENLEVLCKSCHAKRHTENSTFNSRFVGLSSVEKGMHYILKGLRDEYNLDLTDVNFKDTPKRVARAYAEIFEGVKDTKNQIKEVLDSKFPSAGYDQLIIGKDITTFSMCPHHFLPVKYEVHVGYIPSPEEGFVLGISKLGRLVEILSKRPVLQETLTQDIGKYLELVKPQGVMVYVRGQHMCMQMRGVQQTDGTIITSYISGAFKDGYAARSEFLSLCGIGK